MNRLTWLRNALAHAGYDLTHVTVSLLDSRTALTEDFDGTLRLHFAVSEHMVRLLADMVTQYVENSEGCEDTDKYRMARALQAEFDALLADAAEPRA